MEEAGTSPPLSVGMSDEVFHLLFLLSDLGLHGNHSSPHRHWFGFIMVERLSEYFSDVTINIMTWWALETLWPEPIWLAEQCLNPSKFVWGSETSLQYQKDSPKSFLNLPLFIRIKMFLRTILRSPFLLCLPFCLPLSHVLNNCGCTDGSQYTLEG